jgi:hypothetical protein
MKIASRRWASYDLRMQTPPKTSWKHLAPKPGSQYQQLFVKGRNISARSLYGCYAREDEPLSPAEIAADRNLPLEAVLEAIAYCESEPPELARDFALEAALMDARGINEPGFDGRLRTLSPEEKVAITRRFN